MRIRSGRENERPISIRYLPKVVSHFSIIMSINYAFDGSIIQEMSRFLLNYGAKLTKIL
jgi:hypothetical protein